MVDRKALRILGIVTALIIFAAGHFLKQFDEPVQIQAPALSRTIMAPVVNRDGKGNRLPAARPVRNKGPIVRTKLPIGCDLAVSPLAGMQSENLTASSCIS